MLVIIIFVTILSSVSYSVYSASTEARRTAGAVNYAVDIFECIGRIEYDEVDANNIAKELKDLNMTVDSNSNDHSTGKIGSSYNYEMTIQDHFSDDTIKIITLKITYKISAKNTESIELTRMKLNA